MRYNAAQPDTLIKYFSMSFIDWVREHSIENLISFTLPKATKIPVVNKRLRFIYK